jgi:adenylate cyclase class 2
MQEIELKFKISDIDNIRKRIENIGAEKEERRVEKDVAFDKDRKLKEKGELLRLRRADDDVYLTFKSPEDDEDFKEMEEIELKLSDFEKMKEILGRIDFEPQRGFKKDRETWLYKDSEILIDRLSFGNFLEIEGSKKEIREIANLLDLDWGERMTENYLELYKQYCKKKGIEEERFF